MPLVTASEHIGFHQRKPYDCQSEKRTEGGKESQSAVICLGAYRYFLCGVLHWPAFLGTYKKSVNNNNHWYLTFISWVSKVIPYILISFESHNSPVRLAEQELTLLGGKFRFNTIY